MLLFMERNMNEEQALWFTFLYLTYYRLDSALAAFKLQPTPGYLPEAAARFPCATERRNLRGGKVLPHVADYMAKVRAHGSQRGFLRRGWNHDPVHNYEAFWETAQTIWNNGRWAAFKWSELLKQVHDFNLAAPDMRMQFCSGPKAGLELLYNAPNSSVAQLNAYGVDLRGRAAAEGFNVPDWETLETVLCNFHSLRDGRYYIGHDIDELQHVLEHGVLTHDEAMPIWDARAMSLPESYLGELNGWSGVDKQAKQEYKLTGLIVRRHPSGFVPLSYAEWERVRDRV